MLGTSFYHPSLGIAHSTSKSNSPLPGRVRSLPVLAPARIPWSRRPWASSTEIHQNHTALFKHVCEMDQKHVRVIINACGCGCT